MMNHRAISVGRAVAVAILAAVAIAGQALAQDAQASHRVSSLQVGGAVEGVLALPSASFASFPGVNSCAGVQTPVTYQGNTGSGLAVNGMLSLRPALGEGFADHLGGQLKVGFALGSTSFTADEYIGQASDPNGTLVNVMSRYTVTAKTSELRIEPSASYWLSSEVPLLVSVGAHLGYSFGGTFSSHEDLVAPSGAVYSDGSTIRNQESGDLIGVRKLQVGLTLGVAYDIGIGSDVTVRPELSGLLGLTSPMDGISWHQHELRLGVAVLYALPHTASTPLQEEH